jgi:hypothetical protein
VHRTCLKRLNTHQATCLAAQDSCSITVPVFLGRRFRNFRLVMGSSVVDLENRIIAENIIEGRIVFTELEGQDSLRPAKSLHYRENIFEERLHLRSPLTEGAAHLRHVCQEGEAYDIVFNSTSQTHGGRRGKSFGLGKGDIGVFVAMNERVFNRNMPVVPAAHCPGTQWLVHAQPPSSAHPDEVSAVARACGGSDYAQSIPDCDTLAAVSPAACQSLRLIVQRAHAEAASAGSFAPKPSFTDQSDGMNSTQMHVVLGSRESDFKMLLSPDQLLQIIGTAAYHDILAALQVTVPDAIVLRRTVATGRFIAFHTDHAARTVQVPLNHDSCCVGGRLLFACTDGKLLLAQRKQGHILVHDGDAAHGVTRLIKGVRFGLYALRSRGNE